MTGSSWLQPKIPTFKRYFDHLEARTEELPVFTPREKFCQRKAACLCCRARAGDRLDDYIQQYTT